jgi:hypothetical protein
MGNKQKKRLAELQSRGSRSALLVPLPSDVISLKLSAPEVVAISLKLHTSVIYKTQTKQTPWLLKNIVFWVL